MKRRLFEEVGRFVSLTGRSQLFPFSVLDRNRARAKVNKELSIKDPFVLEFLGLKDEYSEAELEDALIRELEQFLLELGNDFAFIARQKRLRSALSGTVWISSSSIGDCEA